MLGSAETRAPSHGWRRAPRKRIERVDIATDQIGFPDGNEGGPAAAPSLRTRGCRAPGRDRRARSPGRALPFSSRTTQNSALCVAGTDRGLGGRVHAALMQGVVLPEKLRGRTDPSRAFGGIKGATTRLTAPAYWKFESSPLLRGDAMGQAARRWHHQSLQGSN